MKKALGTIFQYLVFFGLGIWIIYHMLHQSLSPDTKGRADQRYSESVSISGLHTPHFYHQAFYHTFFRALRWRLLLETAKNVHPYR